MCFMRGCHRTAWGSYRASDSDRLDNIITPRLFDEHIRPQVGTDLTLRKKKIHMMTGLHAGPTRSFRSSVPASGFGLWMFFSISYLYIRLHCSLARVWLQRVLGWLYLTRFVLRLDLALPCPCLDLCCPGLAPVLTCPKPNCYDTPDSILVLTMH